MFYYNGKITCFQLWIYGQRQVSTRLVTTFAICPEYFLDCSHSYQHLQNPKWLNHFVLSTSAESSQDPNLDYLGLRRYEIPALSS